jgi:hypothetical protein
MDLLAAPLLRQSGNGSHQNNGERERNGVQNCEINGGQPLGKDETTKAILAALGSS